MTDDELAESVVDGLDGWEVTDFVCSRCLNQGPSSLPWIASTTSSGDAALWAHLDGPLECRNCGRRYPTHIYRGRNARGDCLVDIDL